MASLPAAPALILIAGNGPLPEAAHDLAERADCVIRFNDCRSAERSAHRTDIVAVCNTGRPGKAMATGRDWQESTAVSAAGAIWCVRDPSEFGAFRAPLAITHPDLEDFCDDYSADFARFAHAAGKTLTILPHHAHRATVAALAAFDPAPYVVPSSGLITISHVLDTLAGPESRVVIAGFGHVGWEWHPFAAEKRLVDHWAGTGRLTRLEAQPLHVLSEGAA